MKVVFYLLCFFLSFNCYSKFVPDVPSSHCTDNVGVLKQTTIDSLNLKLQKLQQQTGTHFLVYVDDTLYGENLEEYVNKLFNAWKLGEKEKNNGVLFAVFIKDRAFRIAVGYGLEANLPDLKLNRLQEELLIPKFKQEDYNAGILDFTSAVIRDLNGEEAKALELAMRLQIADPDGILSEQDKFELFYNDKESLFGRDYETMHNYYRIQANGTAAELLVNSKKQWEEILKSFPNQKYKLLIAYSVESKSYAILTSEELSKFITYPKSGTINVFKDNGYINEQVRDKDYRYLFSGIHYLIFRNIEKNQYLYWHPISYYMASPFFSEYDILQMNWIAMDLLLLIIYFSLLLPLLNLFILIFLYKAGTESRKAFIGWVILNLFVPIIGTILQGRILYKLIKIIRKKGNYSSYISTANKMGVFGYLNEFSKGSGGSSGYTYSSSGSSYSSSKSSYSSSSSSRSSYSGYSGGGGGSTGGGGSSGRW